MNIKMKNGLVLVAFSLLFTVAYGNGKGASAATIISLKSFASNVLEMVVNAPTPATSVPKSTTDLVGGTWANAAYSVDGNAPFATNNLVAASDVDGTNKVIYLEANNPATFFGIGE